MNKLLTAPEKHQKQVPKAFIRQTSKRAQKHPKMTKNDQKHQNGQKRQKTPKNVKNGQKTPKITKNVKNRKVSNLGGPPGGPPGPEKKGVTK